jgi:transcriptional regulator with XRE-family HTH domain
MKGGPIWPRAGSFYGRLISAMEDWQHKRDPEEDEESRGETEIGRFLEQKRKERGLSLEEVEQATKIRKRYLTGLERANYSILPDAVYARGFLKTYANYLGLDGEALSRRLKSGTKVRRERGITYNSGPESNFEKPLITPSGLRGAQKHILRRTRRAGLEGGLTLREVPTSPGAAERGRQGEGSGGRVDKGGRRRQQWHSHRRPETRSCEAECST